MSNRKDSLEPWISGSQTAEDNKLRAIVGKVNAEATDALAGSIELLREQLRLSVVDLKKFTGALADSLEKSNAKLAARTHRLALSLNALTFFLVVVGLLNIFF